MKDRIIIFPKLAFSFESRFHLQNAFKIAFKIIFKLPKVRLHKLSLKKPTNYILRRPSAVIPQKQLHPTAFITKIAPEKMPTKQCMLLFYSNFDSEFSISHFYENAKCFRQKLDKKCSCSISPNANTEANGNIFVLN